MSSSKVFRDDRDFVPSSLVAATLDETRTVFTPVSPVRDLSRPADTPGPEETVPDPGPDRSGPPLPQAAESIAEEVAVEEPQPETPSPPPPDIEAIRDQAYEQGRADAAAALQQDLGQAVQSLIQAAEKLDKAHHQFVDRQREEVVNLAVTLARHILGREPETQRDLIVRSLDLALSAALRERSYEIWVHPDDLERAREAGSEFLDQIQHLDHIEFRTDAAVGRGGCRLEGADCLVDATLSARLESAREFLLEHGANHCLTDESGPGPDKTPTTS